MINNVSGNFATEEKEIEYIKKEYEDMPELYEQEGSIKDQLKILEGDK